MCISYNQFKEHNPNDTRYKSFAKNNGIFVPKSPWCIWGNLGFMKTNSLSVGGSLNLKWDSLFCIINCNSMVLVKGTKVCLYIQIHVYIYKEFMDKGSIRALDKNKTSRMKIMYWYITICWYICKYICINRSRNNEYIFTLCQTYWP